MLEMLEQCDISGALTPVCADLSLVKDCAPDPVVAGKMLTYTLVVTNEGPRDAHNVVISDTLPDGTAFVTATLTPSGTDPLSWYLGSVRDEHSRRIQLVVQIKPHVSGTITNTAVVSSITQDSNGSDDKR